MKLVYSGEFPGMNEILAKALVNRNLYGQMKKRYTTAVMLETKNQTAIPLNHKINLSLEWFVKNRKRDPDNIMSGIKFILDGIVLAGLIPNDTQEYIGEISHRISLDKECPRCEVSIEACPDSLLD